MAERLVARGYLRLDRAPLDAPFTEDDLAENFRKIAFRYEFQFDGDRVVEKPLAKRLSRWSGPIRYRFVGDAHGPADAAEVTRLMVELSGLTGLDIAEVTEGGNMLISIATPAGRRDISRMLGQIAHPAVRSRYDIWRRTPGWICGATLSAAGDNPDTLVSAHVFLGSEVSGRLRRACLHEEIVQSLGLTNDSPAARPSIFNDDQEFALMTAHDAVLLRLLYHSGLRTGMSEDEAMSRVPALLTGMRSETAGL